MKRCIHVLLLCVFLGSLLFGGGCTQLFGGIIGGRGFTITADPSGGHPPFDVTLTATAYYEPGTKKVYGTYVWETPIGSFSNAGENTFSIKVTDANWEITGYWVHGDDESQRVTVTLDIQNSPPQVYEPLNNGTYDRFLRPGPSEHILWWPVNKVLSNCAPDDRRGIYDPDGDEVTVISVRVGPRAHVGPEYTIFTPPYTELANGNMRYNVHTTSMQYENAAIVYPGYTATEFTAINGRPEPMGPIGGGYIWNSCFEYGLGCDPLGECVFIYILVEDEWGARNSAVFLWPLESQLKCDGLGPEDGPFPTDVDYDLFNDDPDGGNPFDGGGNYDNWDQEPDDDVDLIEHV